MFNQKFRCLAGTTALLIPVLVLQGSCQTTTWTVTHSALNGSHDATATLIEEDIEVHPPNPPLTWDYTVTITEIELEDKDMDAVNYTYGGTPVYIYHEADFGPHLPDCSALTYARYMHADWIDTVSDDGSGGNVSEGRDSNIPSSWATCTP